MSPVPISQTGIAAVIIFALATVVRSQTTTAKLFLPNGNEASVAWSGSVIAACSDSTTYALRCTGLPTTTSSNAEATYAQAVSHLCGDADAAPLTITEGPSGFYQAAEPSMSGVDAMKNISCALSGTTEATCSWIVEATHYMSHDPNGASAVMTGTQVPFIDVTLTAGVQKLAKATEKLCSGADTGGVIGNSVSVGLLGMVLILSVCAVLVL